MLPNHSPLTVAEQFGMLATLHPGRIELGLGRLPGTDLPTVPRHAPRPGGRGVVPPRRAGAPGATWPARAPCPASGPYRGPGPRCRCTCWAPPLFGAQLAAVWSVCRTPSPPTSPPRHSRRAGPRLDREQFEPSEQLAEPRVLAAMNVIVAHDASAARHEFDAVLRARVAMFLGRGAPTHRRRSRMSLESSAQGRQVATYDDPHRLSGTGAQVADQIDEFRRFADADEVIVAPSSRSLRGRLDTLGLIADGTHGTHLTLRGGRVTGMGTDSLDRRHRPAGHRHRTLPTGHCARRRRSVRGAPAPAGCDGHLRRRRTRRGAHRQRIPRTDGGPQLRRDARTRRRRGSRRQRHPRAVGRRHADPRLGPAEHPDQQVHHVGLHRVARARSGWSARRDAARPHIGPRTTPWRSSARPPTRSASWNTSASGSSLLRASRPGSTWRSACPSCSWMRTQPGRCS